MSFQVCHCGWSKVTTYQGLRIHQGKMGCTPRGVKVEESEQHVHMWGNLGSMNDFELDVYTYIKTASADYYSDKSLQVCHCGWSKMTTFHGLRTHQGMMGCLLKGARVPKKEQYDWKNQWGEVDQKKQQPAKRTAVKKENVPKSPKANVRTSSAATTFTIKDEYKSDFETPQPSFQTAVQVNTGISLREDPTPTYPIPVVRPKEKDRKERTLSQIADSRAMTGITSRTATIKEEPKSPLAISRRPSQRAANKKSVCQPRDLSTAEQVNTSLWEDPTPTYPIPVVRPKEKDRKEQTSQIPDSRVMTGIDSRTNSARTTATIKEEPKSPLAISRRPSQRTTSKKSVCQPHDFSTAEQNVTPESVMKPVYRPPLVPLSPRINSATPATIKEKPKSSFAAPQRSVQKVTNSEASHQLQDISTGLQVNRSSRACPTIPPPATVVQLQEKVTKDQTLSQACQERVKSELQQKIQLKEEKMGEIIQMERASESVPDLTCTNTQMNPVAAEATMKEDPKSLCETSRPDLSTGMRGGELVQMFPAATTEETAVQPKDKNKEERKLSQVEHLGQTLSATTALETSVQPKEKDKENQSIPQNEPDSTIAATTQVNPASAEARTGADPAASCETAQLSDFSTGLKVKELARMFSAATTQETAVQQKEKHREQQKPTSQAKLVAQKLSAATAQETAVKPKQKDEKDQNLPQNMPDSTKTTTQMNPAPAQATTEEALTSFCGTAQLWYFSTDLKVKELARMFSAATTQETAVRPQEKHREQQKLPQVKLIAQKLSATTVKETVDHPKDKHKKDQSLPQNLPNLASATTQMNPSSAEATTEEDPKSSFETAKVSDFSTGLTVKELARMFSAATTQETAARPKEKHREQQKRSKWI